MVWEPANVRKTSCTAWDPWTTHVLWLFQWARTVCEQALSGAAIVFQRGWRGPPTCSRHSHVPLFPRLQSKLWPRGSPVLSQLACRSQGRGWSEESRQDSRPRLNEAHRRSSRPRLHSSSPCLLAGAELGRALRPVVQKTNYSRPSGVGKKQKARGNEVPTDAHVTGWRPF